MIISRLALALSAATIAACAAGPDYVAPTTEVAPGFASGNQAIFDSLQGDADWWKILNDPVLDALIEQAMHENHDVRIAEANVAAARGFLSEEQLNRYPVVTTQGSVSRRESSSVGFSSNADRTDDYYEASLDAIWELDFFGRVRRANEAASADYQAAISDQRNVFVIIAAEVTRTYIELRGAQYRLAVARDNVENQTRTYELTLALLAGGRGTDLDLARAQAQMESTRASIPPLESQTAVAMHRLAVLTGRQPAALKDQLGTRIPLPALPDRLPVGDPVAMLRRRPDIAGAERRLAAATARIGVQTADLFPRVNLVGSFGYLADGNTTFASGDSERTLIGPFLTWPAFDLGRVKARIRVADAAAEAQLATYEQTVLIALEETENALVRYARNQQRLASLNIAADASARAAELARVRYRNGVDSFLNVLDAEARLLDAQDALARSETDTGLAFVALYKALGGGWENFTPALAR